MGVNNRLVHFAFPLFQRRPRGDPEETHLRLSRAVANVQEGFGGVEPEDAQRPAGPVGQQQRHRPVQAQPAVQLVGEGVQVIEPVGFPVSVEATESASKGEKKKNHSQRM